jgi:PII-like signaling protein
MLSPGPAAKVIIHLNEDTSSSRDFLYREIFGFLFDRGVAGATMIRPVAGFGSHHHVHTEGSGGVEGEHLPVRIEFLESPDVVNALMPELCALVSDGVVEMQATTVVKNARRAQPV